MYLHVLKYVAYSTPPSVHTLLHFNRLATFKCTAFKSTEREGGREEATVITWEIDDALIDGVTV